MKIIDDNGVERVPLGIAYKRTDAQSKIYLDKTLKNKELLIIILEPTLQDRGMYVKVGRGGSKPIEK